MNNEYLETLFEKHKDKFVEKDIKCIEDLKYYLYEVLKSNTMFDFGVDINIDFLLNKCVLNVEKCPQSIAINLYNLAKDMDFEDYDDEEQIIVDLENAMYWLKATAENKYNQEFFRTLYRILERL